MIAVLEGLITVFVFSGIYLFYRGVREKLQTRRIKKRYPNIENYRNKVELAARCLQPANIISTSSIKLGLANIEHIAKMYKPSYICGLNRGGGFLAHYYAKRLGIPHDKVVLCNTYPEGRVLGLKAKPLQGRVLMIDDVVRSGKTMEAVSNFIGKEFPGVDLFSVAIVAVGDKGSKPEINSLNYFSWYTNTRNIQFPWSSRSRQQRPEQAENHLFIGDSRDFIEVRDSEMNQLIGRLEHIA